MKTWNASLGAFTQQARFLLSCLLNRSVTPCEERHSMKALKKSREQLEGRVLVPALLWMAGVPFGVVVLLWFFFFRGH